MATYFINYEASEVIKYLSMKSTVKNMNGFMGQSILTDISSVGTTDL
jgi:hypothetical protein